MELPVWLFILFFCFTSGNEAWLSEGPPSLPASLWGGEESAMADRSLTELALMRRREDLVPRAETESRV